jgi:hypothetical protein
VRRHGRPRQQQPEGPEAVRVAACVPARDEEGGAAGFDAYAHHPYYGAPGETPATPSPGRGGVTLGNIDALVSEVTRLYGRKRIWITV